MNGDAARVRDFAFAINAALRSASNTLSCVFCPPMPYLSSARGALPQNAQLMLGAQNCHAATSGAFTGEVSATMLKESGCSFVIVGHSERRAMGETDADVAAKAAAALEAGLTPIICIGESLAQYEAGKTAEILTTQLTPLAKLPGADYLIAYEPIWAIGTGKTPKMPEIASAHSHIKSVLGSAARVLYGGSVNPGNVGEILGLPGVDGALIGGASLEISTMRAMMVAAAAK